MEARPSWEYPFFTRYAKLPSVSLSLSGVFDAETIREAKYGENPCTAQEMAFRAAMEMAKQGKSFLNQMRTDYQESGADAVGAAPAVEEEEHPMTDADRKAAGAAMAAKLRGEN